MSEKNKTYPNGDVTIVWKPDLCIHSERCWRGLPEVFDPKARPWIDASGAGTAEIIAQVRQCPSGALSTYLNAEGASQPETAPATEAPLVELSPNGPLLVHGPLRLRGADGAVTPLDQATTAFCRCGHSQSKPFCDGSHRRAGFQAD